MCVRGTVVDVLRSRSMKRKLSKKRGGSESDSGEVDLFDVDDGAVAVSGVPYAPVLLTEWRAGDAPGAILESPAKKPTPKKVRWPFPIPFPSH